MTFHRFSLLFGKNIWVYDGHPEFDRIVFEKDYALRRTLVWRKLPEYVEVIVDDGEIGHRASQVTIAST